jgi:hypothetical protein
MFKSSENLRLAADMRALERVARPWREIRRDWFDGTPESIEARLAATERVLAHARGGVTPAHVELEREASTARAELREAAHRLLVDPLDDGARNFKGSRRVAGKHDADPEEPWKNQATGEDTTTEHWDKHLPPWDKDYEGKHRESSYRLAERGLRECINCGGALSGEEGDDKDSECGTCGKSAHEKGVDWRKKSRRRVALDYDDTMSHIDDVLAEGEGHDLHAYPGLSKSDIDFDEYGGEDDPDWTCSSCGEPGALPVAAYDDGPEHDPDDPDRALCPDCLDDWKDGARETRDHRRERREEHPDIYPALDDPAHYGRRRTVRGHDEDDDDICSDPHEEGCRASLDDGEGFDGYCGNCADRLEAQGHWAHHDASRRTGGGKMTDLSGSGTQGWPSASDQVAAGNPPVMSLPSAVGQVALNGSTMTGQEEPAAFNPGPRAARRRGSGHRPFESARLAAGLPTDHRTAAQFGPGHVPSHGFPITEGDEVHYIGPGTKGHPDMERGTVLEYPAMGPNPDDIDDDEHDGEYPYHDLALVYWGTEEDGHLDHAEVDEIVPRQHLDEYLHKFMQHGHPNFGKESRLLARLAASGMSYEDAMAHINEVLNAGEGHDLHHQPGVKGLEPEFPHYDMALCRACGGDGRGLDDDACEECGGTGENQGDPYGECEGCGGDFQIEDLTGDADTGLYCPDCGGACDYCGLNGGGHRHGCPER